MLAAAIAGCATPQKPVSFQNETANWKTTKVGIVMTPLPKVDTFMPGASCLLCIAAATVANNALIDHSRTLTADELLGVKARVAQAIRAKGGTPVVIDQPLDLATLPEAAKSEGAPERNFTPLRERYGVDKLIVIQVQTVGMWRTYSAYFATSDPKATLQGRGFMVNLADNRYEWLQPVAVYKASDKGWDEPPKFPGLTNAYYVALELGADEFVKPFQ